MMNEESPLTDAPSADEAHASLHRAHEARALGASSAIRPLWYYPALGGGLLLALASFSIGQPAIGVVVGLVILPVSIELLARQRTEAAPLSEYTSPAVRSIAITYVLLSLAVAATGVAVEEAGQVTGAAAAAGVLVLVLTVVAGRMADRRRAAPQAR